MTDTRDTIFELYQTLMPYRGHDGKRNITKTMWKNCAEGNFNIIAGMIIGTQATTEQLKQIKEILLVTHNSTEEEKK